MMLSGAIGRSVKSFALLVSPIQFSVILAVFAGFLIAVDLVDRTKCLHRAADAMLGYGTSFVPCGAPVE